MPLNNDNLSFLATVKGIIWDLDNTLYRFNEAFTQDCNLAAAKAALEAAQNTGKNLTFDEALHVTTQSFRETGHSLYYMVEQYGIDQETLHHLYHKYAREDLIDACKTTSNALRSYTEISHAIVTHASRSWAERVLRHLGLDGLFPASHILAREDFNFEKKSHSTLPFQMALDALSLPIESVIVAEDIAHNLRVPAAMGMKTVLIHHGNAQHSPSAWISLQIENAPALLALIRTRKACP